MCSWTKKLQYISIACSNCFCFSSFRCLLWTKPGAFILRDNPRYKHYLQEMFNFPTVFILFRTNFGQRSTKHELDSVKEHQKMIVLLHHQGITNAHMSSSVSTSFSSLIPGIKETKSFGATWMSFFRIFFRFWTKLKYSKLFCKWGKKGAHGLSLKLVQTQRSIFQQIDANHQLDTHCMFPLVNCSTLYHLCTYGYLWENWATPKFVISGILVGQQEAHVWRQDATQSVCKQNTSAHPLPPLQHHQEQQAQHVDLRVVFFPFKYAAYKYLLTSNEFSLIDRCQLQLKEQFNAECQGQTRTNTDTLILSTRFFCDCYWNCFQFSVLN